MPLGEEGTRVSLDDVARSIVRRSGLHFGIAADAAEVDVALRLRADAVAENGWTGDGRDAYDDRAVHLVGWDGRAPVCAGRIVFPPGRLPTEEACGFVIAPAGGVADVGRMVVARSQREFSRGRFVALLAALYLEVRAHGVNVACGMMAPSVRTLTRFLGLHLELLGPDRDHFGEPRAPVRFELARTFPTIDDRLAAHSGREDEHGVGSSEAECVGDPVPRSDAARLTDDDVQLHLGVDVAHAGRRWNQAFPERTQRHDRFDRA
jgi:hypothetical protein